MADEEEQDIPEEETPNEESLGSEEGANGEENSVATSAEGEEQEEEEEVVILPPEIIPAKEPDCPECKSGAPAWMATFADMATLLMAFFVLILSFAHMNVPKFKNVSGSMKSTFGVQRSVPVVEPPTAQNIIAQNYRTAKVEPTIVDTIEEQKTDVPQPEDQELKSDDGDGESETNADVESVKRALSREIAEGKVTVTEGKNKQVVIEVNEDRNSGTVGGETSGQPKAQISQQDIELFAKVAAAQTEIESAVEVYTGKAPEGSTGENSSGPGDGGDSIQDQYDQLRADLSDEISKGLAEVIRDGDKIIVRLAEKGSFRSGDATLRSDFTPLLQKVGGSLSGSKGLISVEGHTDNVPIAFSDRFRTNWDLSAARSAAVADYLLGGGYVEPGRVNVLGFADTKPIDTNDSAAGRAKNRRIEVIVGQ